MVAPAGRQLRLLLWKDYLVRKRNFVTLGGVVWATMIMMGFYVVRINVDNQDFPDCQYQARALPSAGMLTFVQSFICSVDNQCKPIDQYQEIPSYENSKLSQVQRKLWPVLSNSTVLGVAGSVPGALKLLATLSSILDEPALIHITKNGLTVQDLFHNPITVRRYIVSEMNISQPIVDSIMTSQLSIQGIMKNNMDRCNTKSISSLIKLENMEYLETFVNQLCRLSDKEIRRLAIDLLLEINFSKYIPMIGNMYYKLSGDNRVLSLAALVRAAVHATRLDSYLPPIFTAIFERRHVDFSYFNVTIFSKLLDEFQPTFGKTQAFQILSDITDTVAMGLIYFDKIMAVNNQVENFTKSIFSEVGDMIDDSIKKHDISSAFSNAIDIFEKATANEPIDIFKILSQMTNFISKLLPDKTRHDVQFYSTLLAKLIEGANKVVSINWNIKEMVNDVSLRNPAGVSTLKSLPLHIVRKGLEALADAERVQILTSKLNVRGQIFCDSNKMANFFRISKKDADSLKSHLCTDAWKNYMGDMMKSFGIYEVRDLINNMASLMIQETFGKDTSDQLYPLDKDFQIIKNFTDSLIRAKSNETKIMDWNKIFNVSDDSEFMKIFSENAHLGKQILITVHGGLAKEVVKQNTILEYKLAPILIDMTTVVQAINAQLRLAPDGMVENMKRLYPNILRVMLNTVLDENKTYRALSAPSSEMVCDGTGTASKYLDIAEVNDKEILVATLCDASKAIDKSLKNDSFIAKAITVIRNSSHGPLDEVNWTKLISEIKDLYVKLDRDYPYLFEFTSYGMDEADKNTIEDKLRKAKQFWFNTKSVDKGMHLSVKLVFRLLDLIDSAAFNVSSQGWLQAKFYLAAIAPSLRAAHAFLSLLSGVSRNETYSPGLPAATATALSTLVPNAPHLIVDATNIILHGKIDVEPLIALLNSNPPWPCSSSFANILPLSSPSKDAVKAVETLMCMDDTFQEQWSNFIRDYNLNFYVTNMWNTTTFQPHLFLNFSGTFDGVVEDITLAKDLVQEMMSSKPVTKLTLAEAWKYAANMFERVERNTTLKSLFSNIDTILNRVSSPIGNTSMSDLWVRVFNCSTLEGDCQDMWRAAWKYSLEAVSVVLDDIAGDLFTYFTEINEPDASLIQMLGFTRHTGLYVLYDRLPEFIGVLLNSFWDYGFMTQIRRASVTEFWDCEAVLNALVTPASSNLDAAIIASVRPFVCPSLLYWISMPRGANTFLNIVAKPQYTLYNMDVQNMTSRYESAFIKSTELVLLLKNISNKNNSVNQEETSIHSIENKLRETVDSVLNYRINETTASYRLFNEVNKKQFISAIYLTRITAMVNKLAAAVENLNPVDIKTDMIKDDVDKIRSEISTLSRIFKRRPQEAIAFHFDVITNMLATNGDSLVKTLEISCNDIKNNDTSKDILSESKRIKNQICGKDYKVIYRAVEKVIGDDLESARKSLVNMVNMLQDKDDNSTDIFKFFMDRKKLINSLKISVKYSYDLGLPIYLKYLQSNLQSYNVVLSFVSGDDWWSELKALYNGPRMNDFYKGVEKSFDIAADVLTQLDKIQIVRLLRDMELNNTSAFCQSNVSLSEYIPDGTGILSQLKEAACANDYNVFKEIPSLVFASQGFDEDLKLSKDIDYTALNSDIAQVESRLGSIRNGPQAPRSPIWVTDEGLAIVKRAALGLVKGEALTKATFGLLVNIVDAGTLFLNNSQCTLCSQVTTWVKQINLQLYKRQEYYTILCPLSALSPQDIHRYLKDSFHWDMAFKELISSRNYTKFELNKSLNEFLELVKLQVLEELNGDRKLADCFDDSSSTFAATFLTVTADILTLFRVELPHLHEVEGMTEVPFLKEFFSQVAPNLDVYAPLHKYLVKNNQLSNKLAQFLEDQKFIKDIETADVNLRLVRKPLQHRDLEKYMKIKDYNWSKQCKKYNCKEVANIINQNINVTLLTKELPNLQATEFWKFKFVSDVLYHVERVLKHMARLAGVLSKLDLQGVGKGRVAPTIDLAMELLTDDTLTIFVNSIRGILEETAPLLNDTSIAADLGALIEGLLVLQDYKNYLIKKDIKVPVGAVWSDHQWLERALQRAGINHTNLWGAGAARVHAGHIALAPLLSWKSGDHISNYVCQVEEMSRVIFPDDLGPVSRDDVLGSLVDQFCGLSDQLVKEMVPLLIQGMNYTYIFDKVTAALLTQLYTASNLTQEEGDQVSGALPLMATVLPSIQAPVGDVAKTLAHEPLLQSLRNFSSVGSLLETTDFMSEAGKMLCGRPFTSDISRVYRSVLQNKDMTKEPDKKQLESLPTEFCRSIYKGITETPGGKIVWSFVKPLLLGKILYTPQTQPVQHIIHKANSTFAFMANLTQLIHSFAEAFSSVDQLSTHRNGVSVLKSLLSSSAFEDLRTKIIGEGDVPGINLDNMFDDFGDLQGVGNILSKASSLVRCISLDRFRATADEHTLSQHAAKLAILDEFTAGLVFLNNETDGDFSTNIQYKIRMDIDNTPTTARLKNYLWIPGPEDNFLENMRYFRGFVQLQDMVDRAIIEVAKERSTRIKRETRRQDKWAVYTQQLPYPCYRKDFFQTSLYESQALIVAFFFSLLFTVASAVRFLVADIDSGNTALMAVMGVRMSQYTFSWALWSCLELTVTYGCVCAVLCGGGILPRSSPSLVLALLMIAQLSVLSFCYMMSKLFGRASVASVCAAIAYLVSFMPIVLILSLEAVISKAVKLLICLSMSSSLCYAFVHIGRYEAMGMGAQWAQLWAEPSTDDVSIGLAAIMMLIDAAIYFAIGYAIDYFYGLKTLRSCIIHCDTTEEKAGVSIVNVSKVYGEGSQSPKVALDNVSIELHRGQITTLLGHNGAGKTTLINILTGMAKPSKGHVIIRSEKGRSPDGAGSSVGVCPQRDVLFPYMTPREHVALYAQLKDVLPPEKLKDEVDSMLKVLSLGGVSDQPVCRLSGGTRRRVCVALAFVGRGTLVMLDEPTAGVDPAARRAIWSLIVRLRGSRAVLLTTHHLHEAELLSDHLVILHQGQVHTVGSPIEIKRSLGHGYRLSVTYPDRTWSEDEPSVEERSKQLLTATREVIANASIAATAGLETEVTLPFYDSNGLNNDFLRLCKMLETQQENLGFSSYALDCSSLEHVMADICQQGDHYTHTEPEDLNEAPSKSTSTASIRTDSAPLVGRAGPVKGSTWQQFTALMRARYLHFTRNKWLSFVVLVMPALFVCLAMGFSCVRPPADNELPLLLSPELYHGTDFLTYYPSMYSKHVDPLFAENILRILKQNKNARNWTEKDTPTCECGETRQVCHFNNVSLPATMMLPNVSTLNDWLLKTQEIYIEKRYGGFTSALTSNVTNFIAWYNNKGHHALPAYVSALNSAILKHVTGYNHANITTFSHPMKISKEQISKDTVYQHIADAGISGLVLLAYCLVSAGGSIYLVTSRVLQEKRLQLLCGVSPALYWCETLTWDMLIIVANMVITAILMEAFHFPVFVARNNLPAICLLIFLYGFACSSLMHVLEKLFVEASVGNMLLFCGNAFLGLGGLTVLLILDLISQSERTDNARWVLHKIFMLAPPFALGDGLLEIAKNTIQAQVLARFGMETYKDPLSSDLVAAHYLYLTLVGAALFLFNLAIEYQCFDYLIHKVHSEFIPDIHDGELEDLDVAAERRRVQETIAQARESPLRLHTIGNINAGFVDSEGIGMKNSSRLGSGGVRIRGAAGASCLRLGKVYRTRRVPALRSLTLTLPPAQCTALLGENGAGKSTTFSLLTGQLRPTTGQIYLQHEPVTRRQLCKGLISYCPQNNALDPLLTVRETLSIYCQLRGIEDQDEVIKRTMEMFELSRYTKTRAGALSGGNKRKLCTAIAFMSRAPLVLLDEPTSGMDPASRLCVARGVRLACADNRAVLLSTHQLQDARRLATRVALLQRGSTRALQPLHACLTRFGGGYIVECRVGAGTARAVWRAVKFRAPTAVLQLLHHAALHFLIPIITTVNMKETNVRLSDIFRLMAELQGTCDIEDYTINQSSLDQMFLSFSDKVNIEDDSIDVEPLPATSALRPQADDLASVTAL